MNPVRILDIAVGQFFFYIEFPEMQCNHETFHVSICYGMKTVYGHTNPKQLIRLREENKKRTLARVPLKDILET